MSFTSQISTDFTCIWETKYFTERQHFSGKTSMLEKWI